MAVVALNEQLYFPDIENADDDGLLAVGADLSVERLLLAYRSGIFPWFEDEGLPFWFSPDPRCVLYPTEINISKSMKTLLNRQSFTVSFDRDFVYVIEQCAETRRKQDDLTWISPYFIEAYTKLHEAGYAHSVEVWKNGTIVGGLYGVSIGACFSGESMFTHVSNASKFGFIQLVKKLAEKNFVMIDCQVMNPHLKSLGAKDIDRKIFLGELKKALKRQTIKQSWEKMLAE
ncbi:MAG: leucyl/phenylalanyl-tRNA--protein transferase [Chitinophagales bacterium]